MCVLVQVRYGRFLWSRVSEKGLDGAQDWLQVSKITLARPGGVGALRHVLITLQSVRKRLGRSTGLTAGLNKLLIGHGSSILSSSIEFYWDSMHFTELHQMLVSFIRIHWIWSYLVAYLWILFKNWTWLDALKMWQYFRSRSIRLSILENKGQGLVLTRFNILKLKHISQKIQNAFETRDVEEGERLTAERPLISFRCNKLFNI